MQPLTTDQPNPYGTLHALSGMLRPTTEQDTVISDFLFRQRWIEVNPWYEYPSRLIQTALIPLLFFRYVEWFWLLGWVMLWLIHVAIGRGMAFHYRHNYQQPPPPAVMLRWQILRTGYQATGWFIVGLAPLFCFWIDSDIWVIAGVAATVMLLVYAPFDAGTRGEIVASAGMTAPMVAVLLSRATPLYLALAALAVGMTLIITVWGMQQIDSARKEILMRLMLQEAKDRAEQANIAKSKFLAAASHDLRQPLHALTLFVATLNEKIRSPDIRVVVDNIKHSVTALEGLFNALLDISRLDASIVQPKIVSANIQPLFQLLDNEYAPQARSQGLELNMHCDDIAVKTDPVLLETILRNLISNAIRYTLHGRIHLRCMAQEDHVRIEIQDSGIGISPENQQEVFNEFVQLQNPERDRNKGLGLGLAIVKRLVNLMQHDLQMHSIPGTGTNFRLRLPIAEVVAAPQIANDLQKNIGGNGMRVLVIDDEAVVRMAVESLLSEWGYAVIVADSAEAALNSLHTAPDVIIADYRLRENLTGVDAIRAVQSKWGSDIPALIITGDTGPEQLREASTSGFSLLHKPVQPGRLRAFLRQAARGAGKIVES